MTQPISGAQTPEQDDKVLETEQLRSQPSTKVRRPVLPAPTDMFSHTMTQNSGLETPERIYRMGEATTQQEQAIEKQPSTAGHSHVSYNIGGAQNTVTNPVAVGQQSPNYRAGETSAERQQKQQQQNGRTTLVPNFRSISPSIFNIDLNQTVIKGETTPANAPASPHQSTGSNRNQIFVSIHQSNKRVTEANELNGITINRGGTGSVSGANYGSQGMHVRRIGPLKNKGDKIKFGVLVSRETKRKQKQQSVDFLQPHEIFETPKSLNKQGRIAIGKHSEAVNRIIEQRTYTTTKTLPTVLVNQHTNVIKQFNKNFTRETDAYSRHSYYSASRMGGPAQSTTVGAGADGYHTETQSLQTHLHGLNKGHQLTASRMSKKSFWSDDRNLMSIRDVIEEHARSVAAIKKSFRPNVHFEIDELRRKRNREIEEKGRKIAKELNLSPVSCCTRTARFYRSLTAEQPVRQHNKPLTHLMRPNQKLIVERKQNAADEALKLVQLEKHQLKRRMNGLQMSAMHNDLKGGIATVQRGTQLRKDTLAAMKEETELYKKRMRSKRSKDDWDQERKDIETSIDNGMTFSHLSRKYPMKREWAKYLVLLKAKEKGRRQKERKVREVLEDLHERGVRDDKQIQHELDLFEYQEFKKKRDKSKARMGAKAAKYYRPVDTDRTLEIQPISMDMTDDYDDGPGGFKLEDFEGVETMFSKQSLEQRKLRVDRARERLREKRMLRLQAEKMQEELQIHDQPPLSDSQLSSPQQARTTQKAKPPIAAYAKSPRELSKHHQHSGLNVQEIMPKINVDDQRQQRQPMRGRYDNQRGGVQTRRGRPGDKPPSGLSTIIPPIATDAYHDQLPGQSIQPTKTEKLRISARGERETDLPLETLRTVNDIDIKNGIHGDKDGIRVMIASGSVTAIPNRKDTLNNEYSLEDGGIFEKKTLQHDGSAEQVKLGSSVTHQSYEVLTGQKKAHDISSDEMQDGVHSEMRLDSEQKRKDGRRTVTTNEEGVPGDEDTEMGDHEDVIELVNDGREGVMPMTTTGVKKIEEFLPPKTRPSTTDHVRRIVMNRRRQLMSGANKQENVRASEPDAQNLPAFGRYQQGVVTQKSVGVITTVFQAQRYGQKLQRPINEGFTSTGLGTDAQPSGGALLSGSGVPKMLPTTLRDSGGNMTYSQKVGGLSRKNTMENWRSEHKVIIWKEIMKTKPEHQGKTTVSRQLIRNIRNKIRRERRKRPGPRHSSMSHNNFGAQSFMMRSEAMANGQTPQRSSIERDQRTIGTTSSEGRTKMSGQQLVRRSGSFENDGSVDRVKNIRNNAKIAQKGQFQKQPVMPQILQVQDQNRSGLTQFTTQQHPVDRTYFTNTGSGAIMSNEGASTCHDHSSSIEVLTQMQQNQTQGNARIVLGGNPAILGNKEVSYQSMPDQRSGRKNFVDINRHSVHENAMKVRLGSNLSRLPKMRNGQAYSTHQLHLQENMTRSAMNFNQRTNLGLRTRQMRYPMSIQRMRQLSLKQVKGANYATMHNTTAKMYEPFQDQIMDRRSMQVFRQNELNVDPDIENEFTRQQAWNKTLNCPYYGLMSLRMTQDKPINSITRVENILQPFTTGNKQDRMHIRKVKSAINHRNKLREMDKRVYRLIEACQDSQKIHWKQIYDQNEDFRNSQRKKITGEPETPSFDDYEDMLGLLDASKKNKK